jgi:DNA-binding NarL/FixJ family response regulator
LLGTCVRSLGAADSTAKPVPLCHHSLELIPTVLIVDDHPSFRSSARAVLEADGFDVVGEAEDGATALAANKALKPDIVLLDVQLPDANGFDLCGFLCEIQPRPDIVLVSSRDASDFDGLVEQGPARGFIAKADLSGDALRAVLA